MPARWHSPYKRLLALGGARLWKEPEVRFGSLADICVAKSDVRFTPNSDRKSRHVPRKWSRPLSPRKRTFQWDTLGRKPNYPVEGFRVPLFGKRLIRLRWRSPLGTARRALNFQVFLAGLSNRDFNVR